MRLFPFQPLRVLLGIGGGVGLAVLFLGHPDRPEPDLGRLGPVYAEPAERVEIRTMRPGETLGGVLARALAPVEQYAVVMAFQEHASPRRLREGTEVTLRYRADDRWLRGVDVTLSADETVRLTRDAVGWNSSIVATPIWTDTLFASGAIESSLWTAVSGNPRLSALADGDYARLIDDLDKVFQWKIDFWRQIQRGDHYRFAYERKVRPDGTMQSGKIVAAELVNRGRSLHAIWFDPEGDGKGAYYDVDGQSLQSFFLLRPLEFRRISSGFTSGRLHPILGTWRAHRGVDFAAATGTPVQATGDGIIVHRGVSGGYGNLVEIRHSNGYTTRYAHLSRFQPGQAVGSRVAQGEVIGLVGMTGLATGPHLHYEMLQGGRHIDPLSLDIPAGEPVPSRARDRWTSELVGRLALLEALPGPGDSRYAARSGSSPAGDDEGEGQGQGQGEGRGDPPDDGEPQ